MTALLVTYDLQKPGQDYSGFYDVIKSYPWAKLSESSYAIATTITPSSIYDQLSQHADQNDHVYVIGLKGPWRGRGLEDVNSWLEKNL